MSRKRRGASDAAGRRKRAQRDKKRNSKAADAERHRRARKRDRLGLACYRFEGHEVSIAAAMIASGRLSESEALDHSRIEAGLKEVVMQWVERWLSHA